MEIFYKLLAVFDFLAALAAVVAAVVTAIRCGQKKLSPAAGWVLAAGFGALLFTSFAFLALELVPTHVLGYRIHQGLMLSFNALSIAGLVAVGAGIGMFPARPTPGGR
jgi:hypothetical protein